MDRLMRVVAVSVGGLLLVAAMSLPAASQSLASYHLQWGFRIYNLPANSGVEVMSTTAAPATAYPPLVVSNVVTNGFNNGRTGKYLYRSEDLPYRVPEGYELGITYARLDSKYVQVGLSSLLAILNVASVLDHPNEFRPASPVWLPAGSDLRAVLINNDAGAQVMVFVIQGVLVPAQPDYRLLTAPR